MILNKTVERKDFYINFYKILNSILNLSNKELAIISLFATLRANLPKDLDPIQFDAMTFSAINRKFIAQTLGISNFNLNNYVKSLKRKKVLMLNSRNKLTINPGLYLDIDSITLPYTVEFNLNIDDRL